MVDLERDGVTLKELEKRKFGLTAGLQYNFITKWMGVKYSGIDQFADDKQQKEPLPRQQGLFFFSRLNHGLL